MTALISSNQSFSKDILNKIVTATFKTKVSQRFPASYYSLSGFSHQRQGFTKDIFKKCRL